MSKIYPLLPPGLSVKSSSGEWCGLHVPWTFATGDSCPWQNWNQDLELRCCPSNHCKSNRVSQEWAGRTRQARPFSRPLIGPAAAYGASVARNLQDVKSYERKCCLSFHLHFLFIMLT